MGEYKILLVAGKHEANQLFLVDCRRIFKGYTLGPLCEGVWVDADGLEYRDSVQPLYIATDDSGKLVKLVADYQQRTGEVCVYLRHPNGHVQLVGLN